MKSCRTTWGGVLHKNSLMSLVTRGFADSSRNCVERFTSTNNVTGVDLNQDTSGRWGGVVLSGRAPVTDCIAPGATPGTTACERQVEGAAQPALFGGATADDSSGSMTFVQIRYSGFVLSGDNELQSLTTGGVGSGTTLNNIMSYNSSDDGAEFFGGSVRAFASCTTSFQPGGGANGRAAAPGSAELGGGIE